jgi:hypothetical protein
MDSSSYSAGGSGTRAAGVSCWSFFFLAAFSGSAAFRPRNGWRLKADSFSDLVLISPAPRPPSTSNPIGAL